MPFWLRLFIATVSVAIEWLSVTDAFLANSLTNLYTLIASISVTLLGFVLTALSILVAVPDKRLISSMKESGHYAELTNELFWTAVFMFAALLVSVINLFFPVVYQLYALLVLSFIFILALLLFSSSGYKFYLVMEFIGRD